MGRRGFVLVLVLFALVLLAAFASAGLFEALQELRIGRNTSDDVALRTAAESGIASALASWDPRLVPPVGGAISLPGAAPPGMSASVDVRRLNERLVLLLSSVTARHGISRQIEQLGRLQGPEAPRAALRARAADQEALSGISGIDTPPSGWSCPPASDTVPGAMIEPGASDSAFFSFGVMDWAALVEWARTVPPGGDSLRVVFQPSDTVISGGRWTGTLVVGGDLMLRDGVQLAGLIVVKGTLRIGAGGATVFGSVTASQVLVDQYVTPQSMALEYSSCSALRASLSRAHLVPLPGVPAWGVY